MVTAAARVLEQLEFWNALAKHDLPFQNVLRFVTLVIAATHDFQARLCAAGDKTRRISAFCSTLFHCCPSSYESKPAERAWLLKITCRLRRRHAILGVASLNKRACFFEEDTFHPKGPSYITAPSLNKAGSVRRTRIAQDSGRATGKPRPKFGLPKSGGPRCGALVLPATRGSLVCVQVCIPHSEAWRKGQKWPPPD